MEYCMELMLLILRRVILIFYNIIVRFDHRGSQLYTRSNILKLEKQAVQWRWKITSFTGWPSAAVDCVALSQCATLPQSSQSVSQSVNQPVRRCCWQATCKRGQRGLLGIVSLCAGEGDHCCSVGRGTRKPLIDATLTRKNTNTARSTSRIPSPAQKSHGENKAHTPASAGKRRQILGAVSGCPLAKPIDPVLPPWDGPRQRQHKHHLLPFAKPRHRYSYTL